MVYIPCCNCICVTAYLCKYYQSKGNVLFIFIMTLVKLERKWIKYTSETQVKCVYNTA